MIGVELVADLDGEPMLCGRPSVDWLLDTVESVCPAFLTVTGDGAHLRDRVSQRPALRDAFAGACNSRRNPFNSGRYVMAKRTRSCYRSLAVSRIPLRARP